MPDLDTIHSLTPAIYEANAKAWDEQRSRVLFESPWLDRFAACLNSGCCVLDVGCGAGEPITRYLLEQGLDVSGLDVAESMLRLWQARYSERQAYLMDMRLLAEKPLGQRFDGIIAWDSFFHLNQTEQRAALAGFCRHLIPGGALLLTAGDAAGEATGWVNGQQVYHASLEPAEYQQALENAGFRRVELAIEDPSCDQHSIVLASDYSPA